MSLCFLSLIRFDIVACIVKGHSVFPKQGNTFLLSELARLAHSIMCFPKQGCEYSKYGLGWAWLGWAGIGCAWLSWDGLGWAGLGWAGLGCDGLDWVWVGWAVPGCARLGWNGLGWVGLGWAELGWAGPVQRRA